MTQVYQTNKRGRQMDKVKIAEAHFSVSDPFGRRVFLKSLTVAGLAATTFMGGCTQPEQGQQSSGEENLDPAQIYFFNQLTNVLLPVSGFGFPDVLSVPLLENIKHFFSLLGEPVRSDLKKAITVFDYGAIVSGWHFKRFVSLSEKERTEYIIRWQEGNELQRAITSTLKKIVYTAYWREPLTWKAMEFDGPVSEKWGLAPLGTAPIPKEA